MMISETSKTGPLTEPDMRSIVERALAAERLDGKRVLVIIPDHTRSGPDFETLSHQIRTVRAIGIGCLKFGARNPVVQKR